MKDVKTAPYTSSPSLTTSPGTSLGEFLAKYTIDPKTMTGDSGTLVESTKHLKLEDIPFVNIGQLAVRKLALNISKDIFVVVEGTLEGDSNLRLLYLQEGHDFSGVCYRLGSLYRDS